MKTKSIFTTLIIGTILLIVGALLVRQPAMVHAQEQISPDTAINPSASRTSSAFAVNSSCGEPLLTANVDVDRDGVVDRVVDLDQCYRHNFTYAGVDKRVIVYYTVTNGTLADRLPDIDTNPNDGINDIAAQLAQWTEEAWRRYRDYGFNDPLGRNDFAVAVFDVIPGYAGRCCSGRNYEFDAPALLSALAPGNDPRDGMGIAFHETWHAVEHSNKGGWIDEATASNMMDHVNLQVDLDNSNDYIGKVKGYMNGGASRSLTTSSYEAAMWWTYYMEQLGLVTSEPDRGVDAMLQFWDNLNADGLTTLDNVIRGTPGGRTFESVWIDFTVANYAKELTGPGVPDKYQYQDELQAGAPDYPPVRLELNRFIGIGEGIIETGGNVQPWSAKYYQVSPDPAIPIINLDFRLDIPSRRAAFTLLAIKNNDIAWELDPPYIGGHFVQSIANDDYDRIVVIVTGLQERVNFRYAFNATAPVLNIIDPLQSRKAQAGDPASPDKILVKVEVLSPLGGGTPVAGIALDDFVLTIGSKVVPPADLISRAYVQGQYWFLFRAPTQSADGDYNLQIDFATLSDTEAAAVHYAPRSAADNVLIMDRSGSMGYFGGLKLQAAKDAARLYVDSWRDGDKIGLVSFNDASTVDVDLADWDMTPMGSRDQAIEKIKDLLAGGNTAIGNAALTGMGELVIRGDPNHSWALILLSDGIETVTEPQSIRDFLDAYTDRKGANEKVPQVHVIALGPDADLVALEQIANVTGGSYQYAGEPLSATRTGLHLSSEKTEQPSDAIDIHYGSNKSVVMPGLVQEEVDLPNDLAEIYRIISESVAHQQQIYSARGTIRLGETVSHAIRLDGGASEGIFTLNWDSRLSLGAEVRLYQPDGTLIQAPTLVDSSHSVWRLPNPMAGEWLMTIGPQEGCEFCVSHYLVEAALKSDLTMDVFMGLAVDDRLIGRPMPILVSLSDQQSVPGAVVNAQITDPAGNPWNLSLYDDGLHGDGSANDGFYGNTFHRTALEGSYVAAITAQGTSTLAGDFQRRLRASFNLASAPDNDQDGIPDWADPTPDRADALEDPDLDGVTNIEEFRQGTNPLDSDTDNGGESDGSEWEFGSDPLEPVDDQISCIPDFQATNVIQNLEDYINPRGSVLEFSVALGHDHFVLRRGIDLVGPWPVINDQVEPTGQYIDDQVTLGTTYYYFLQAVDQAGHRSCILGPRSTTPKVDSVPPTGYVLINDGARATASVNAVLTFVASLDTVEMIVSNNPDFDGADWEPYQSRKPWQLEPQNNLATVYVGYRDASGNESEILLDSIDVIMADLLITQTDSPDPVIAGNHLSYWMSVTNNGPDEAREVVVTDSLPAGVTFTSATPSPGNCVEAGGLITCDLGDLASGASASLPIVVTVNSSTSCDTTLMNTAEVTSIDPDPDLRNNTATTDTLVLCRTDLSIAKADSPDPVYTGSELTYELSVFNNGPSDASRVTVIDTLPVETIFNSATTSQGSCGETEGSVSCDLGSLASGAGATITILVTPTAGGLITNTAHVSGNETDPDSTNNTANSSTTVIFVVGVDIKPGNPNNPVNPGNKGQFTVAILSAPGFDAPNDLDWTSLTFGRSGNESSLAACQKKARDVNHDGLADLVCHFYTELTGLQTGDTEAILKGSTRDDILIEGREFISIVPPKVVGRSIVKIR